MIIFIISNYTKWYFIALFFVVVHELTHILTARLFNIKCSGITVYPTGLCAELKGTEKAAISKRLLVLFSGPFFNFAAAFLLKDTDAGKINIYIGLFNLLPVYCFDGFGILQNVLGYFSGTVKSSKYMGVISRIICSIIFVMGILQLVFFPYNFTIFLVSIFLYKTLNEYENQLTYKLYKTIFSKCDYKFYKVRHFVVNDETTLKDLVFKMGIDYYTCFYTSWGNTAFTEKNILEYITIYGVDYKLVDIPKD